MMRKIALEMVIDYLEEWLDSPQFADDAINKGVADPEDFEELAQEIIKIIGGLRYDSKY